MDWVALLIGQMLFIGLIIFIVNRRKNAAPSPVRRSGSGGDPNKMKELTEMRERHLNMPLSERARPACMDEIIGQADGIHALRAA